VGRELALLTRIHIAKEERDACDAGRSYDVDWGQRLFHGGKGLATMADGQEGGSGEAGSSGGAGER